MQDTIPHLLADDDGDEQGGRATHKEDRGLQPARFHEAATFSPDGKAPSMGVASTT